MTIRRLASRITGQHRFKMADQLYRSASSIPTNIVEGTGRDSRREFARFLEIAAASASELEYHLLALIDAELLPAPELQTLIDGTVAIRRMLCAFMARLRGRR